MSACNDAKELFLWVSKEGEAKAADRILIKIMPALIKEGIEVTAEDIKSMESFLVSEELFEAIKTVAEDVIGKSYKGVN